MNLPFSFKTLFGEPGKDLEISVPPGVTVKTDKERVIGTY